MIKKKWLFSTPGKSQDFSLLREAGYPRLISLVLNNRAISSPELAGRFFSPAMSDLEDPWLLPDIEKGITRVIEALNNKEKIMVYGDYDVDGTTGTTILYMTLKKLGAYVDYYLPHRLQEGYGLNIKALELFARNGVKLIITVDCGTTNVKEVEIARSLGIDVIITDHHESEEENIPSSCALINPKMKYSRYPFPYLAGVGVVLKFIQALISHFPSHKWEDYLGLAALGTIADIVPMVKENRIISYLGLKLLNRLPGTGLKALMDISSVDKLDTNGVLFKIAPRINALGRLDNADLAVKLLSVIDINEAREVAAIAEERNKERKTIQDKIMDEALELLEKKKGKSEKSPIILSSQSWHVGVLGIVASKLVEKYYRPVYLIMSNGVEAKGSARGIEGFSIFESLSYCQDILAKFGGHALAGGFSLSVSRIEDFIEKMEEYVQTHVMEDMLSPTISIEGEAYFPEIDLSLAEQFKAMEPFGSENSVPIFCSLGVQVLDTKFMGKDEEHFKLILRQGDVTHEAVGFMMGKAYSHLIKPGSLIDIVYSIDINYWRDEPILRLTVKDLRPSLQSYISISSSERRNIFLKNREASLSPMEKSIVDNFLEKKKIIGNFHNFRSLINVIHHLILVTLYQKNNRLLIVHPLKFESTRHYNFLKTYFSAKGIRVFLLNGSVNAVERENLLENLKLDFPCLIITTFDYMWLYKDIFFSPVTDLVVIDDNLLDYSGNVLIQLDDLTKNRGFLFCTLSSKLRSQDFITISTGKKEKPHIIRYNDFPGPWFCELSGKTLIICANDDKVIQTRTFLEGSGYSVEILLSGHKVKDQKKILDRFKSGESKYLLCSTTFLYEIVSTDNLILLNCPFTWNEFCIEISMCKHLYLAFSEEDIRNNISVIQSRIPDRNLLIRCYKLLNSRYKSGSINLSYSDSLSREIMPELVKTCLAIFEEIGLYRVSYSRTGYSLTMIEHKEKLDLLSSPCYVECLKHREHFDKLSGYFPKINQFLEKYITQ